MAKSAGANKRNDENKINPGIKLTFVAVAILCVIMLVYTVVDSMGIFDRNTTAMTVGEDEINVSELSMYYHTSRSNFLSQYADVLMMYGYDYTSSTFDAQPCLMDNTVTWRQYFLEEAEASAQEISILYQEAQKNGYTEMSEADKANYDNYFTQLSAAAKEQGVSESKYLKMVYGNGATMEAVQEYYAKRCLAAGYYETVVDSFGIDQAQIDDYYASHAAEYDLVEYYAYDVDFSVVTYNAESTAEGAAKSEEEAKAMTQANMDAAKADADALLAKLENDGSNFDETIQAYLGDKMEYGTGRKEVVLSSASSAVQAWLKEDGRAEGDKAVILDETNQTYTVVVYIGTHADEQQTLAVRHTLLKTETAATSATDAEKAEVEAKNAEVKAQAEALYSEWKAAGATEEAFIQMAKDHSEDGSASQGGLYTGVFKGQMVEEFDAWCFDEARQPGDHGIVETSYGYHIMYFVEHEGLKVQSDIRAALESEAYNEYLEEMQDTYDTDYNDKGINRL
ncbi:MAG: peptidylprolyl isomerase [Clostridia bacterium]|nr:peptidylprolyl isomerase [Clostridia bacterium]